MRRDHHPQLGIYPVAAGVPAGVGRLIHPLHGRDTVIRISLDRDAAWLARLSDRDGDAISGAMWLTNRPFFHVVSSKP